MNNGITLFLYFLLMRKVLAVLGVIIVAAAVAIAKYIFPSKSDSMPATTGKDAKDSSAPSQTGAMPASVAKQVATTASYTSPAGSEEVRFNLFLDKDGAIVETETDVLTSHPISKMRQQAFADGLLTAVKGKKLSELMTIDKVGGSSLTTQAFNDSLDELRAQL